jgi:hypothetical protein
MAVLTDRSHNQRKRKGDSHDKLSRPHDRRCPRTFAAGAAAIAGGIRHDPEHCRRDGHVSGSDQQPHRFVRDVHGGSFTEAQIQTVLLTDAVTIACTWAVAFHTALALKEGLDPADVQAIRDGRLPKDSKLAALSALARRMIEKRGRLDDADVDRFIGAGFGKDHTLEVIAIVAASTITNYTGSVTKTPLGSMFQAHAWAG